MTLPNTTLRNFGGGWNVSDSDLNLNSSFQPVSDNVVRGIDGSFSPRQGCSLWADFRVNEPTDHGNISLTIATTNATPNLEITFGAAHGLSNGDHITISGANDPIGGISADHINGTYGLLVVDADTIKVYTDVVATSTASHADTYGVITDDNELAGNIIHDMYFNRRLLVFTDIGEIAYVDDNMNMVRIWGISEAEALSAGLVPTRKCEHWSSDAFKSTVIACNGYDKDKPVQIMDDFTAEFLVDKATLSNAAVPKADRVVCLQGYVCFIRTEYGDPFIEMSAKGTDGTFTRDPNPADSVEVDLSMITSSVEPVLLGAAPIRDKLYTAFYDKGMVGALGIYNDAGAHNPDFKDTIAENGTISHRTMVPLGNDIFMCDYGGVPSVSISQQSAVYVPTRLSELIAPAIQAHLSALNEETLRSKAFAVFNRNDKSYMLFLPIYDEVEQSLTDDPFIFNDELRALKQAVVIAPNHNLFNKSNVTISGATSIGSLLAADINGVRNIVSVVDDDSFVVQLGDAPENADDTSGGGPSVTFTPINDETIVYAFEYNKEFKIRRWTRYRDWNFDCACSSQRGKVFMCKGLKVYRMGDNEIPLYADFVGDYDERAWGNNKVYNQGIRVRDPADGSVYVLAITTHTTPNTGTFADDRADNPDIWEPYVGNPIEWATETPWSDMRDRGMFKIVKYVNLDSEGTDRFTLSAFVNKIRTDPATNALSPYRSMSFQAGDTGGWGMKNPGTWGSGRRTREEKIWPMEVRGKLVRWRWEGSTTRKVKITSLTMYYRLGNIRGA